VVLEEAAHAVGIAIVKILVVSPVRYLVVEVAQEDQQGRGRAKSLLDGFNALAIVGEVERLQKNVGGRAERLPVAVFLEQASLVGGICFENR